MATDYGRQWLSTCKSHEFGGKVGHSKSVPMYLSAGVWAPLYMGLSYGAARPPEGADTLFPTPRFWTIEKYGLQFPDLAKGSQTALYCVQRN